MLAIVRELREKTEQLERAKGMPARVNYVTWSTETDIHKTNAIVTFLPETHNLPPAVMAQALTQELSNISVCSKVFFLIFRSINGILQLGESSAPPRSPSPVQAEPELPELCACPPSDNMVQLMDAGIELPVHYYGFLVDGEPGGFLQGYARSYVHPDHVHKWTTGDLFALGLRQIYLDADLRREPEAKIAWVDNWAKADCPRVQKPVGRQVVVLPLFSNTVPSYDRRPTQKQMDLMSRLLGQQPRWWQAAPM